MIETRIRKLILEQVKGYRTNEIYGHNFFTEAELANRVWRELMPIYKQELENLVRNGKIVKVSYPAPDKTYRSPPLDIYRTNYN